MSLIEEWRWDLQEELANMTPNTPRINTINYCLKELIRKAIDGDVE